MDKHVVSEISRVTGRPALSTATAVQAAFSALGAKRLVFISETKQPGHDKKKAFLREAGYEIVADKAVGLSGSDEYCTTPPQLWFDTAVALKNDKADAYFIYGVVTEYCVRLAALALLQTGKPVSLITDAIQTLRAEDSGRTLSECTRAGARLMTAEQVCAQ
jgi:maleate cis-trans isomerase